MVLVLGTGAQRMTVSSAASAQRLYSATATPSTSRAPPAPVDQESVPVPLPDNKHYIQLGRDGEIYMMRRDQGGQFSMIGQVSKHSTEAYNGLFSLVQSAQALQQSKPAPARPVCSVVPQPRTPNKPPVASTAGPRQPTTLILPSSCVANTILLGNSSAPVVVVSGSQGTAPSTQQPVQFIQVLQPQQFVVNQPPAPAPRQLVFASPTQGRQAATAVSIFFSEMSVSRVYLLLRVRRVIHA